MTDPLAIAHAAAEARREEHQMRMHLAAATARSPGEWIDIFQQVVEFSVKSTMEEHGDGDKVLDRLSDTRTSLRAIRIRFEEHGLPLLEDIETEGPDVFPDAQGNLTNVSWPRGEWVKFYWPGRNDCMEFRGHKALVALCFIMWWVTFQKTAKQWADQILGKGPVEGERRMIEPGTPEWNSYWAAKKADLARMDNTLRRQISP